MAPLSCWNYSMRSRAVFKWFRGTLLLDGSAVWLLLSLNGRFCWMAPGCLEMVPRDAVVGWLHGTLWLNGRCCWMAPLNAVVVAFVEWTLLLDGSAERCGCCFRSMFFRSRLLGWKGCAIKGCCCEIMCVLSSVGRVSRLLQGKNQTVF